MPPAGAHRRRSQLGCTSSWERRRRLLAARAAALPWALGLSTFAQAPDAGRARPPRIYSTQRLAGQPPSVDRHLNDEARKEGEWAGDYVRQLPVEGGVPSQKTGLKILYDDQHLYLAIRAYDDMTKITRYPARRDGLAGDIVGVCFDSYFDTSAGFEFDLNSAGTRCKSIPRTTTSGRMPATSAGVSHGPTSRSTRR